MQWSQSWRCRKVSFKQNSAKCYLLMIFFFQLSSFKVKIEVTECPKDPNDWKQKFSIYRVGLEESLIVDLEMLCDCPCETPGNPVSRTCTNILKDK